MSESIAAAALVVDDDEFVRQVVVRQLKGLGYGRVLVAADGEAALRACRDQGPFRLMVTDLKMPGIDGVQLLREVAGLQPDMALILISSVDRKVLATVEDLTRARGLRLLGSLQKPVRADELRNLLEQVARIAPAGIRRGDDGEPTEDELRVALLQGEIEVHVQPQLDARTRQLEGAEALARWRSPARGMVAPERFIALAERCGLIEPLSDRIFDLAIAAAADWRRQGLETRLSINLSSSSLSRLDLPERIVAACARHEWPSQRLQLEITETGVMDNVVQALDVLCRLRLRGFELAIDDFGTGSSSLTRLKRIPFNELKIDQSFVRIATHDSEARLIVESSINLARNLGLRTVAEGVETLADWQLLQSLGCELMQGYLIARPMPAAELPAWWAGRERSCRLSATAA